MPQTGSLSTLPSLTGLRSITSPYSGKTYTYQWNDPTPPTDDDFNDIISAHEKVPTADEQNIAAATGKSHGAVADFAWNVGKRIADVPSQLLEMSPIGQHAKSAKTLDEIAKKYPNDSEAQNRELEDIFSKSNPQLEQQAAAATKSPWEMTKAAANALDPTGIVPGYMSLGEMGVKDITDKNWAGVTSDVALATAPWLIGKGLGKLANRFAPVETPPEKYAGGGSTITDPKQLPPGPAPAAPRALLGPPREPAAPVSTQRFTVDPNTGRSIDLQDPNTVNTFDTSTQTGLSAFGKGDTVYPSPPKLPRVTPVSGDPFQANALPPIEELPTVDTSVIHPNIRATTIVPEVTPPTTALAPTGSIETGLAPSKIVSGFKPRQDITTWPGAEPPKVVGAGSTIPRTPGLWNRLFGEGSGEYEVGKTVQELQKMKEEFLRKKEEAKNLPPVEPIAGMGRTAPFESKVTEPKQRPHEILQYEEQILRDQAEREGRPYSVVKKEFEADIARRQAAIDRGEPPEPYKVQPKFKPGDLVRHQEHGVGRVTPEPGQLARMSPQELDIYAYKVKTRPHPTDPAGDAKILKEIDDIYALRRKQNRDSEAIGERNKFGVIKGGLPEVDKPQSMSVPPPVREPVTPPDELTHPTAIKLAERVIKLDNQNVPDEAYGKLFTAKKALGPDETWRSRALDYIDHFESIARDNPEKFKGATVEPARGLPTVEPVSTQPTESAGLPEVEPIETPKVIGRGRKPLFAGQERVPRKEWPSLAKGGEELPPVQEPQSFEGARTEPVDLSVLKEKAGEAPTETWEVQPNDPPNIITKRNELARLMNMRLDNELSRGDEFNARKLSDELDAFDARSKEVDKPQEMKVREGGYSGTEDRPVGPVIINPDTGRPNIAELQTLYDNTKPKPGMNHVVLDSGEKYTPEELTRVEKSVTLGKVARIMGDLLVDLESYFDKEELVGSTDKHGFRIADPGSGGMNISDPSTSSPNLKTLVTINPFDGLHTGFRSRQTYQYVPKTLQPPEASRRIVHLIKHEFAHNLAREEGGGFTWAFSQVDTRFPNTTHYESQIFKALTDKAGNYDPEVSGLLQEYLDSRGRSGTKEDILARQAARIEDVGGRKPEGISGDDKPDGEGIAQPKRPKIIKSLREGVASKEQIENELATGDLPQVEPVKNWGGTPETITLEGKGKKLSGKRNKFEYPSESDIPDLPSAPVKPPLAERFGAEPTSSTTKPSFESGKGYIDPNKVDVVYPGREFIKGKGNVDRIMEERAAEKTAESTPSFQDPGGFKANYASPHKTLSANPLTEPIARNIVQAYDKKIQWIRAKLESAAPFISKLGKSDRGLLGKALDTGDFSNLTPELTAKAKGLKNILDQIHTEFPENKNVGYIKNYFTHIADTPKEGMARSIINLFKDNEFKTVKGAGNIGDFYEQGLGTPDSPYIKKRTGALKNINYDVKSVLPQYLDSIAKVIFDQPAVEKAKTYLKNVPEGSKLKDLASWYIKNYTRYDSEAALHRAFTSPVSKIANATARSFIDFNPGLHALHLGELPVNIWPELGSKYTAHGIKEVTLNPLRTWTETSKLGLIQGETKPFEFKTTGERWQSLAYFLNLTEKFVKGVGYEGAKKMYLDQGFSPAEASRKAVELTKDMTLDTGPARQIKGLSNESNTAGGEVSSRLGGQFKGIPIKIAEQMYNVAKNSRANPKAALRMLAGAAAMIYATKKGAHLFHLDPASLARTTALGAFGTAAADFTSALYRGDYETAVENAASWAIPGGQSAKKIYESVTDKESRTKKLAAQREKEGKAWGGPPVNTLKRAVDYMFKGS